MRTTQRKTVIAYARAAADKLDRALTAAAKSREISNAEVVLVREQLLDTRELVARLERVTR